MKILAVDLGDARTGIACCDKFEMMAYPVGVIHEKNYEKIIEKVAETAQKEKVERIVVGYPKNMDGTIGERGEKSEDFVERLSQIVNVPVVLWDERGTTITAIGYLNETDIRGKKRKNVVDAVAATIILENYLSWRKHNKED